MCKTKRVDCATRTAIVLPVPPTLETVLHTAPSSFGVSFILGIHDESGGIR